MERWNGRIALVTGASAGIGAAICRELVKYGMTVVGCARNVDKIKEMAEEDEVFKYPGRIHPIKCDLAIESEILQMFDEIRHKFGRVDVCINNAGFKTISRLLTGKTSDWVSMFEVHVLALCICSRETLKIMKEKGIEGGQIINVIGLSGHRMKAHPATLGSHFYIATKFMVRALTEGLRREVKEMDGNIKVAIVSPGSVKSEFRARYQKRDREIFDGIPSNDRMEASDVADAVTYILKSPPHADINEVLIRPVEQPE